MFRAPQRGQSFCFLVLALVIAGFLFAGCGLTRIVIVASPERATLALDETLEITAVVTGTNNPADKGVVWSVCDGDGENCVSGGNSTRGTLALSSPDSDGNSVVIYTAPSSQPSAPDCTEEEDGCSVVVKAQMVHFEAACFARVKISGTPNPVPTITSINPATTSEGAAAFTLTVDGTNFVPGSVVRWNGSDRPTTFTNDTQLLADIPASDLTVAGTAEVTVFNPGPGGGTSNAVTFTITAAIACTFGVIGRASVASDGTQGNSLSGVSSVISPTGRFVGFSSFASNLVAGDTNGVQDAFLHDRDADGNSILDEAGGITTLRASVASDSTEANGTVFVADITPDGRFVAFDAFPAVTSLIAGDTNNADDIYLRDTCAGAGAGCTLSTIRVSVADDGSEGNGDSTGAAISADGRFVAFNSLASNLVAGDTNNARDVFVRDTCNGAGAGCTPTTVRVSVASDGTQANAGPASQPNVQISPDGRFVLFLTPASNLVPGDTNGSQDAFVHDRDTDGNSIFDEAGGIETIRVSVATDGTQGNQDIRAAFLSSNARFVVFDTDASTLVANDTNNDFDVFVRDTCIGAGDGCTPSTARVSVAADGTEGNSFSLVPDISDDGRFVVFSSEASNLVPADTNGARDIFVHDRDTDGNGIFDEAGAIETVRVSVATDATQSNGDSFNPSVSTDGRHVSFSSVASNLLAGDTNAARDIFVADTCAGTPSFGGGGGGGNPVPVIETISPSTVTVGGADFTLTVSGSGFISSSEVQVDGQARATTFIDANTLDATVLAADIATAGTANVTVVNPGPGGGTSNTAVLNINNPAPSISGITPDTATEGGSAFTLTVAGSGFISSSVVRWNGSDRTTTFIDAGQLEASIPDTDIAAAGTASVTVFNPTPGGGTSNPLTFTIGAPLACTPGVGTRFSIASDGTAGNDDSDRPVLSANGRYVAFNSLATNLVPNDTNATTDIFVHDRDTDNDGIFDEPGAVSTVRVSVAGDGTEANGSSIAPSISPDGRFVAFQSGATNLVANDTNPLGDVFVHDRDTDEDGIFDEPGAIATVRVSVLSDGSEANDTSRLPLVSADGRFTAFTSPATNLVPGDTNGAWDIFVHDRDTDDDGIFDEPGAISTVRVTVASDGTEANNVFNFLPGLGAISPDGRYVVFDSQSTNLIPSDTNNTSDIFVHDRDADEDGIFDEPGQISVRSVSVANDGTQGNLPNNNGAMSADGRFIVFESLATNLIANDANGNSGDIYIHDRDTDEDGIFDEPGAIATVLVSVASDGTQGNNASDDPDISADGRFVVFRSFATNLVGNDTTSTIDIFVHDRDTDGDGIFDEPGAIETVRVSVASDGTEANLAGSRPAISADGSAVVFSSDADNLVPNDNNVARDIFGGEACLFVP